MDRLMIGLGQPHALLDTQYRMHPAISAFPAAHFYGGRLKDDPSTLSRSEAPLRLGPLASLGPLALLHVRGAREEAARDGSVRNIWPRLRRYASCCSSCAGEASTCGAHRASRRRRYTP